MSTPRSYHFLHIISIIVVGVGIALGETWAITVGAALLGLPAFLGARPPVAKSGGGYGVNRPTDALDRLAADYLARPDADALSFILAADELRPVGDGYLPPVSANDRARARAINAYYAKRRTYDDGVNIVPWTAGGLLDSVQE